LIRLVTDLLPVEAIAIRLADEGVPLRAIARATATPSDTLREHLHDALSTGLLVGLPQEDWPPGFPRDQRALQLSRMVIEDKPAVTLAVQHLFGLTGTEAVLLMTLIQNKNVPKSRFAAEMAHKTVDVHVCRIRRRLARFGIDIATLWGYGYQLLPESRRRIMDLILVHVSEVPA
jgi:hypothetical protein